MDDYETAQGLSDALKLAARFPDNDGNLKVSKRMLAAMLAHLNPETKRAGDAAQRYSHKGNDPAYPAHLPFSDTRTGYAADFAFFGGISMRDYFAVRATEQDIQVWIPQTVAGIVDQMYRLGFINPTQRDEAKRRGGIVPDPRLRLWARYRHADEMVAARERSTAD